MRPKMLQFLTAQMAERIKNLGHAASYPEMVAIFMEIVPQDLMKVEKEVLLKRVVRALFTTQEKS